MVFRTFLLNNIKPEIYYKDLFDVNELPTQIVCPFHKDSNPSLSIKENGSAYCFGCKKNISNILEFHKEKFNYSWSKTLYDLYKRFISPLVPTKTYIKYFQALEPKTKPYKWLLRRGINPSGIKKYFLGYNENLNRITLPIFNRWGYCINLRQFRIVKDGSPKVISFAKGFGKPALFPFISLNNKEVIIFEGEMDTLLGLSFGLSCITSTGGCSSWKEDFSKNFKNKEVYICLDNDEAGLKGKSLILETLPKYTKKIYDLQIPKKLGKDFTDFIDKRPIEAFISLKNSAKKIRKHKTFKDPYASAKEHIYCDISPKKKVIHLTINIEDL